MVWKVATTLVIHDVEWFERLLFRQEQRQLAMLQDAYTELDILLIFRYDHGLMFRSDLLHLLTPHG